jgi:nitrous oxidase accessory protein NosD
VTRHLGQVLRVWLALALIIAPVSPARADLRVTPVWWDQNGVGAAPDWHYRVAINVPGGATVNSTVKVDVDFQALLSTMGVTGTFDVNSPRVVRSTGTVAATQEFTDSVFAGVTDTCGMAMMLAKMPWNQRGGATCKA